MRMVVTQVTSSRASMKASCVVIQDISLLVCRQEMTCQNVPIAWLLVCKSILSDRHPGAPPSVSSVSKLCLPLGLPQQVPGSFIGLVTQSSERLQPCAHCTLHPTPRRQSDRASSSSLDTSSQRQLTSQPCPNDNPTKPTDMSRCITSNVYNTSTTWILRYLSLKGYPSLAGCWHRPGHRQ